MDGGRIRTRDENCPRGVTHPHWREFQAGCVVRLQSEASVEDPRPEVPRLFLNRPKVQKLVAPVASPGPSDAGRKYPPARALANYWLRKNLLKTRQIRPLRRRHANRPTNKRICSCSSDADLRGHARRCRRLRSYLGDGSCSTRVGPSVSQRLCGRRPDLQLVGVGPLLQAAGLPCRFSISFIC